MEQKRKTKKTPHKCPVCGKTEFPERGSFDICTECGWEDDMIQTDYPDEEAGANMMSLNEYKTACPKCRYIGKSIDIICVIRYNNINNRSDSDSVKRNGLIS